MVGKVVLSVPNVLSGFSASYVQVRYENISIDSVTLELSVDIFIMKISCTVAEILVVKVMSMKFN